MKEVASRRRSARNGPLSGARVKILFVILLVVLGAMLCYRSSQVAQLDQEQKTTLACRDLQYIGIALTNFQAHLGRYPTTEEGLEALGVNPGLENWHGPYLELPRANPWNDPWHRRYFYECSNGVKVAVFTLGPDGIAGTDDDRVCPRFNVTREERIRAALDRYRQREQSATTPK